MRIRLVLTLALVFTAFCVPLVGAQTTPSNTFDTPEACLAQLGKVPYYAPQFFGNKEKRPVDGKTLVAHPPEEDGCIDANTIRGRKWTPVKGGKDGNVLRWEVAEGRHIPYAIDVCGNMVFGIVYPPPSPVLVVAPPVAMPQPPPAVAPIAKAVAEATAGVIFVMVPQPAPAPTPAPRHRYEPKGKSHWKRNVLIGALVVGAGVGGYAIWDYYRCPPGTVRR